MQWGILLVKMAWRNLGRQRRRTFITVGAMAIGLSLCIPTYALVEGLSRKMVAAITGSHLGHVQIHHPDFLEERRLSLTLPERGVSEVVGRDPSVLAVAPRVYTGGMVTSERTADVQLRPLEKNPGRLAAGRPPRERCEALADARLAREWKLEPGSLLRPVPLPPAPACDQFAIAGILPTGAPQTAFELFLRPDDLAGFLVSDKKADSVPAAGVDDIDRLERLPGNAEGDGMQAPEDAAAVPAPVPISASARISWKAARSFSAQTGVIAVDPAHERRLTDMHRKITAGNYLHPQYRKKEDALPEILLGDQLARQLMVSPGDEVGLDVMTAQGFPVDVRLKVAGVFDSGMDNLDRTLVFVHIGLAWDPEIVGLVDPATGTPRVHELAVRLHEGADESAAAARLGMALTPWRLQVWPWQRLEPSLASMLRVQDAMVAVLLLIIFTIAALGTMNTMLMSVFERVREFGVLRSVGMRPAFVAALILTETLFMTLLASLAGGIAGVAISLHLSAHGLDFSAFIPDGFRYQGVLIEPVWRTALTVRSVVVPVLLLAAVGCVVAVWPALRAARIRPAEAFRQGGV